MGPGRLLSFYLDSFSGLDRRVWLLAVATVINRSGSMVLPFLSLYLTQALELSATRAGQIVALYGVGAVLGSYLGGWLSDRMDSTRVLALSLLSSSVGFLALIWIKSYIGLAVVVTVTSIVAEGFRPALMVAVALTCKPENRTRSFALIRLAANLGMSIGPAIGGVMAAHSYGWLFLGDALTCSAAAVFVLVMLGTTAQRSQDGQRATASAGSARSPWRDLPFLGFCGLVIAMATALFQVWTTFPLFLSAEYHLPEASIGLILALNATLIVLFEMPLLKLLEGRKLMPFIAWGAFLTCAGMGLLPLGVGAGMAVLSTIVWTGGEMLALPLTNAIVAERASTGSTGRYMGLFALTFAVAFIIAPIIGTTIYQHLGPRALWFGIAGFGVLLAAGFTALQPLLEVSAQEAAE